MGRKRQAVDGGNTRHWPIRRCKVSSDTANVADLSDAGKSGTTMSSNTRAKRNPRRGAKGKWDEQKLMTSTKSELLKLDLVKLLARREAWDLLEETEKQEILSLLPDRIEQQSYRPSDQETPKIPPPPESFLRYSNHWRDGVRQFQVDLENGRYDPEWIRQADEAVRERINGEFDNFKEKEFEQFWGQKQTFDKTLAAGESSQVKLKTLIEHGVVRDGDVWKLIRGFSVPSGRLLIEKEAKILKLDGSRMTCVVPAGHRQILPQVPETDFEALLATYNSMVDEKVDTEANYPVEEKPDVNMEENEIAEANRDVNMEGSDVVEQKTNAVFEANEIEQPAPAAKESEATPLLKQRPKRLGRSRPRRNQQQEAPEKGTADDEGQITNPGDQTTQTFSIEVNNTKPAENRALPSVVINNSAAATVESENADQPAPDLDTTRTVPKIAEQDTPHSPSMLLLAGIEVVVLADVHGMTALENKMIEVDGRIKHIPNGNAWKEFRSYRNNQDMGSLWEVRQAWYMRGK